MPGHELPPAHLDTFDLDRVGARAELNVVPDADRRDDQAELERDLAPDHRDTVEQVAALIGVDERNQAVSDLKLHGSSLRRPESCSGFLASSASSSASCRSATSFCSRSCRTEKYGRAPKTRRDQKGHERQPGDDPEKQKDSRGDHEHFGLRKQLLLMSVPILASDAARVIMIPVAVAMSRAGIWLTRPSPTVSKV